MCLVFENKEKEAILLEIESTTSHKLSNNKWCFFFFCFYVGLELREIREIKVEDDPSELHLLDKRDWDPCQDDHMVDLFSFVSSW